MEYLRVDLSATAYGHTVRSVVAGRAENVPLACPPCHPHAISEGQSRYRADNHGHCHPTAELAMSRSTSMNASRGYA